MFFSAKAALILRTVATALVDMSKKAVSGRMPSISPFGPSATCSTSAGTGSDVKTTSLCAPTSRGELAQTAPFARNGSAAARLRSCTTSSCPACCRLAAMPLPIMPSPINPARIFPSADRLRYAASLRRGTFYHRRTRLGDPMIVGVPADRVGSRTPTVRSRLLGERAQHEVGAFRHADFWQDRDL